MARSRFCKPDFFDNPVLAQCSHRARLLFIATWQLADRAGVFEWDEAKIRKYAFGYEDITLADLGALLGELLARGFIQHGEFNGRRYGMVPTLAKHQSFHKDEKPRFDDVAAGTIWRPSLEHGASTGPAQCQHSANHTDNGNGNGELSVDNAPPGAPQTRVLDAMRGKPLAPFVIAEFRRSAIEHDRPLPENHDSKDTWAAATITTKYPSAWQDVIRKYHSDEFYGQYGWSLQNLAKHIDQIAGRKEPESTKPKSDADLLAMAKKLGY